MPLRCRTANSDSLSADLVSAKTPSVERSGVRAGRTVRFEDEQASKMLELVVIKRSTKPVTAHGAVLLMSDASQHRKRDDPGDVALRQRSSQGQGRFQKSELNGARRMTARPRMQARQM